MHDTDIKTWVEPLSQAVGTVSGGGLTVAQMAAADALIDARLSSESADALKLQAAMIKGFLRLPFDDGLLATALARFVAGDYDVSNDKLVHNNQAATSDATLHVGGVASDIWSFGQVLADALSKDPGYQAIAAQTGRQMAMLVYAHEKYSAQTMHAFDVVREQCERLHIAPFKPIHLFEFAGRTNSVIANTKRGPAQLLGAYKLHSGAAGGHADSESIQFVTLANSPGVPTRQEGFNYIIARDVFNKGAVGQATDPSDNTRQLLCTFANAVPDGGKLLISTSINDHLDMRKDPAFLSFAGFKDMGKAEYCYQGQVPSYVLERDFTLRAPEPVTPQELAQFSGGGWKATLKPARQGHADARAKPSSWSAGI